MKINPHLVCELVGDDVLVLDSENATVMTLTGDSATVIKRLIAGKFVPHTELGVEELLAQGVLVTEASTGLSRRSVLMGGAAVGAGGILALSLPTVAYASSAALLDSLEVVTDDQGYAGGWNYEGSTQSLVNFIRIDGISNIESFPPGTTFSWGLAAAGPYRPLELNGTDWEWPFGTTGEDAAPVNVPGLTNLDDLTVYVIASSGDRQSEPRQISLIYID